MIVLSRGLFGCFPPLFHFDQFGASTDSQENILTHQRLADQSKPPQYRHQVGFDIDQKQLVRFYSWFKKKKQPFPVKM